MNLAVKVISNKSKIRRLFLVRKFQYKLRSLKRGRFANRLFSPQIGQEYALEAALREIVKFIECSYLNIDDYNIQNALTKLIKALSRLENIIHFYRESGKAIPARIVRPCCTAIRELYHASKRKPLNLLCDEFWHQFGMTLIVLFNINKLT